MRVGTEGRLSSLSLKEFHVDENPWNHELSGNFPAKSCVSTTYRKNIDFKELNGLAYDSPTRALHGGQNSPALVIERMVKGVTKNREGEKTKVTGISCDGKAVADPTFVNGRQPWAPVPNHR